MPFTELLTPTLFAGALGMAALSFWRRVALTRRPEVLALLALSLVTLTLLLQRAVMEGGIFDAVPAGKLWGTLLLALSAAMAHRGARLRTRYVLLERGTRRSLERPDLLSGTEGVFVGRLHSHRPVTSPGGVVCAFYRAELRTPAPVGEKGQLLTRESAKSESLCLVAGNRQVRLAAAGAYTMAPEEKRRCLVSEGASVGPAVFASGEGGFPVDAVSHERVGRLGQKCWVVGRYVRDGEGERLAGPDGGPVLLVMPGELRAASKRLRGATWALLVGAAVTCASSAALLAA